MTTRPCFVRLLRYVGWVACAALGLLSGCHMTAEQYDDFLDGIAAKIGEDRGNAVYQGDYPKDQEIRQQTQMFHNLLVQADAERDRAWEAGACASLTGDQQIPGTDPQAAQQARRDADQALQAVFRARESAADAVSLKVDADRAAQRMRNAAALPTLPDFGSERVGYNTLEPEFDERSDLSGPGQLSLISQERARREAYLAALESGGDDDEAYETWHSAASLGFGEDPVAGGVSDARLMKDAIIETEAEAQRINEALSHLILENPVGSPALQEAAAAAQAALNRASQCASRAATIYEPMLSARGQSRSAVNRLADDHGDEGDAQNLVDSARLIEQNLIEMQNLANEMAGIMETFSDLTLAIRDDLVTVAGTAGERATFAADRAAEACKSSLNQAQNPFGPNNPPPYPDWADTFWDFSSP